MKGTRWLLAGLLSALFVTAAELPLSAEEVSNPTPRPGIQVGDRFLGFVPKHEQVLLDRGVPLEAATAQPTSRTELWTRPPTMEKLPEAAESSQSAVQTANYEVSFDVASGCECEEPCNGTRCRPLQPLSSRIWGRAEYLYLWTNGVDLPSLATTSPTGTVQDDAGVLPNASTLFGNDTIHDGNSAGRFNFGMWLNPEMRTGVEFTYLFLGEDTDAFRADQTGFDILARPFFNVDGNEQDARLIAFDGLVEGNLDINSASSFDSYEILLRRVHATAAGGRTDMLYGLRRAKLDDVLRISEQTTSLAEPTTGTQFDLFDQYATENEFYGALIGFDYVGPVVNNWSLGLLAKVAVGYTDSNIDIAGQTTVTTDPGGVDEATVTNAGGLLTQASNIGSSDEQAFSTMSEVNFSLTRRWNSGFGLRLGYTFLLWHEVARAGEQVDVSLNPTQIAPGTLTGAARPTRFERFSNFWAQGISAGVEYRF